MVSRTAAAPKVSIGQEEFCKFPFTASVVVPADKTIDAVQFVVRTKDAYDACATVPSTH